MPSTGDVLASVRSTGYRTSLSVLRETGSTIVDRGDHLVVATPGQPSFWWGNFLLLRGQVARADVPSWLARFEEAFPGANHRAFGLDDPAATQEAFAGFAAEDYEISRSAVMTARCLVRPPRPTPGATFRLLTDDAAWEQHVELSLAVYPPPTGGAGRSFAQARGAAHRRAVETGAGIWMGAFVGDWLVAQLGVLRAGAGLGRYQDVETHPEFRRRGLAGELLVGAAELMVERFDVQTLVIVADPDDTAIRLYSSLGFVTTEHQLEASRPTG